MVAQACITSGCRKGRTRASGHPAGHREAAAGRHQDLVKPVEALFQRRRLQAEIEQALLAVARAQLVEAEPSGVFSAVRAGALRRGGQALQ